MKILVTGADGFIGSHLVETLVHDGHDVRAFVYYNAFGHRGWIDALPADVQDAVDVFNGDIRDPHGARAATAGCEAVLHLAALIGIPFSYHSPDAYVDTNIRGTLNLLQAARDLDVARFVQTSTSEVYGTAQRVPIDESHPLQGQSPYAATKIGADQLALSFHRSFDMPVTVLRPFNTFGPRQSTRAVIPTIVTQLAAGIGQIRLGSLHPTRDFSFVSDTVNGFVRALGADAAIGEVINLGSGFEIGIGDTAQLVAELMDRDLELEHDNARVRPADSEVERLWADNGKAAQLLGWTPEFGGRDGFRAGLERTIAWFTDPDNLARYRTDVYQL